MFECLYFYFVCFFRTYSIHRIKDGFREHKGETDSEKIKDLITYAKSNLEIIKRQVLLSLLMFSEHKYYHCSPPEPLHFSTI